ncbi:MAG: hypothetical protein Q9177_002967 [Variospora cf. flavescens]
MLHATGADDGDEEVAGDEEFGDVDLMLLELLLHPRRVLDGAVRDGDAVRHEYLSFAPYDVGGGEAQDVNFSVQRTFYISLSLSSISRLKDLLPLVTTESQQHETAALCEEPSRQARQQVASSLKRKDEDYLP